VNLDDIIRGLRDSKGFVHKRDIANVLTRLPPGLVALGDDCAALPDGDATLLFAIEGFMSEFVAQDPWFAGYCGVMVNLSDIYAMGGRPLAVVDALWSAGPERAERILEGMLAASAAYGVPIVGGHTNTRSTSDQLAVAVLGRATHLLDSFQAQAGEQLLAVADHRGRYREPHAYWDASTDAPSPRLRADLELLPQIAEAGLCRAGKDVSMGGLLGTALMLLECSGLGAEIDLTSIEPPSGVALERWLATFPSYGFLLSVPDRNVHSVQTRFAARSLACTSIGRTDTSRRVVLRAGEARGELWDFVSESFIGASPRGDASA
jgi:AIR synthase-related protein